MTHLDRQRHTAARNAPVSLQSCPQSAVGSLPLGEFPYNAIAVARLRRESAQPQHLRVLASGPTGWVVAVLTVGSARVNRGVPDAHSDQAPGRVCQSW